MQTSLGQGPDVYQVGHGVTRPDHRVDFPETAKLALAILRNLPLGDRETRSNLENSGIEDGKGGKEVRNSGCFLAFSVPSGLKCDLSTS